MSVSEVGLVYARALFDAATEADSVAGTGRELHAFVDALEYSSELANVVFNPQIEPDAKQRVIRALSTDRDPLVAGMLRVLLDKGRIGEVAEVRDAYDQLASAASNTIDVEVTTAVEVGDAVEDDIRSRVKRSTGREPRIEKRVDPAILGGLVLRIGDVIVDGSLRSRIDQLRARLTQASS